MGSKPSVFHFSIDSGSFSTLLMSAESLSTIGLGVLAGAKMPYQPSMAKSGKPASSMVGRSGAEGERVAQVWGSAFTLPARAAGTAARGGTRPGRVLDHEGAAPAHRVGLGGRAAGIGYVCRLHAGAPDHEFGS